MNCPLASFTDKEIQSFQARPVKCFAVQVCKSFRHNWRPYIRRQDYPVSKKITSFSLVQILKCLKQEVVCVQFLLEKCLTRLVTAVKFDRQAGYRSHNHVS